MTSHHHRIYTFDLLRGFAVVTMILAHSVYFFHARDNQALLGLESFGNVVSFVTFLLVSGAVASVAYANHHTDGHFNRRRLVNRVLLLLIAYYLLAFFLLGRHLIQAEGFGLFKIIFDILTFRNLPGFAEYFPPFIFYSALLIVIPRFFSSASKTLLRVAVWSTLALLAGWGLYHLPVGSLWRPWVALLSGAPGLYRFPLLHYLPVFLLGLYWGRQTLADESLRLKGLRSWRLAMFFAGIVAIALVVMYIGKISAPTMFLRWPPTVPFLALGLGTAFLAAALLYAFRQLRRLPFLRDLLLVFGQNALGLFWTHIFLLGLYAAAGGPLVSSVSLFFFLFVLLILLSLALTTFLPFNFRLALTSIRGSHEEQQEKLTEEAVFRLSKDVANDAVLTARGLQNYFFPNPKTTSRRTLRKRHKLGISLALLAASAFVFPGTIQEIALQHQQRNAAIWWSNTYAYRQPVTLKNSDSFITVQRDTPAVITFNHKQLVAEGKSRADGADVKLVYWTGDEHLVAQSTIENPDTDQAKITFHAPVQIQAGKEQQFYYLYYGGFVGATSQATNFDPKVTLIANFGPEEAYPLIASSKTWNVIGVPGSDTLDFHLTTPITRPNQTVTYQILDTNITGQMIAADETSWEATIPVSTLPTGSYRIQATLHDGDRQQTSQLTGFYRTYPLYVAWTWDWEGYDTNQKYLEAMESIATQYSLPVTHFFNPRIYVTKTISPARAQALTQWVQRRLKLGDAIGLHLHMFSDYVEQAGVKPRLEPNWGDAGNGYGVPLSAYTEAEQQQIIQDGQNLLVAHGFEKTTLFRAGGWYGNLDTLAALENLGFTVDSSARTSYKFGRNQLPGYWNIEATMKPYYPSRANQNKSSGVNDFSVLEIPDNGADSYAFSAKDMIERFTVNIGNGILKDKQQLTYLSHPHWFDQAEQTRVRELFDAVSKYSLASDRGPVIFTTTADIAHIWTNDR